MTLKGTQEGNTVQKVVYTRTAAGPAISYNYRVKVTKKNINLQEFQMEEIKNKSLIKRT